MNWIIKVKKSYLPIFEQGGPSEQTAPFLNLCNTECDGGRGISGSGGSNLPSVFPFLLLSVPLLNEVVTKHTIKAVNNTATTKIPIPPNKWFFFKLDDLKQKI